MRSIIKRDGSEQVFDKNKIIIAISKANKEVPDKDKLSEEDIIEIADSIESQTNQINRSLNIEEIQDMVEDAISMRCKFVLCRTYIKYRYTRELIRKSNTTDNSILSLINYQNEEIKQENSNKNPRVNSVQRDYMAGEVSKDLTRRFFWDKELVEAHEKGLIHGHDNDYMTQRMNNCFNKNTRFITSEGVKAFKDFSDGEEVIVLDKDGEWRKATVKYYGKQDMQKVILESSEKEKEVICTSNHRWILANGDVTTNLEVGMVLYPRNHSNNPNKIWKVKEIKSINIFIRKDEAWCVEEPVTHSFTLEDGVVTGNCGLVNLKDMFENNTVISDVLIETPKSFCTACNVMTQIMAQVASAQYGGQSMTLSHIAPYVDVSRKKFRSQLLEEWEIDSIDDIKDEKERTKFENALKKRVFHEIKRGVQIIQYQVTTLMTTNGQAPFITLFMYIDEVPEGQTRDDLVLIIEEVLRQRHLGVKNEKGVYITPAFPKLIYVLDEDNIYEDSKYYYLTEMAAKCTAKRLVPDYISAKVMKQIKEDNVFPVMGCRSALSVEDSVRNEDGTHKFYGRFNQGVSTVNLPDVALSSEKDFDKFWEILDERLELCHRVLRIRHERLLGTPSDVAPILWQHGAYSRLKKGEVIDKLLFGGYSTISLGYAGLYECVKYMTGKSHTDKGEGTKFAKEVMQKLNDKCAEWRDNENIAYSLYGTPIESTTYKFAKCLQQRFGIIEGITDKNYITNSYHVHVTEKIDAFDKLTFESEFQELSPGGAISYIEAPDMQDNIPAIIAVMRHIYETIMYAEINVKSDYCQECGYDGEIKIVKDETGKLIWRCPCCGNEDQDKMNVARRTCGYIGSNFWNQGRTQEINERVLHLDNSES